MGKVENLEKYHKYELENYHTKHRKDYKLTYISHEIYLDDGCDCYNYPCLCQPKWVLHINFSCDVCENNFLGYEELNIDDFHPTLEDFLRNKDA